MNKYKIQLKATDSHGIGFIENVVKFANMGATIDSAFPTKNTFPNQIMLSLETEEFLEDDMSKGIRVHVVELQYTKEMLDEMEWDRLKAVCKERGLSGRDRAQLIRQYEESCGKKEEV
jgi:hypothetical protein